MGAYQRTKGHNFERLVAKLLRPIWDGAKRGFQTRGGTGEAPDVDGTPWYIEVKKGKRTNPKKAYEQAMRGATEEAHRTRGGARPALAITRDDNSHILVTMNLPEFLRMSRIVESCKCLPEWAEDHETTSHS